MHEATMLDSDEGLVCGIHPSRREGREDFCQLACRSARFCEKRVAAALLPRALGADS